MTDFTLNIPATIQKSERTVPRVRLGNLFGRIFASFNQYGIAYGRALEMALCAPLQVSSKVAPASDEDLEGRDPNW